MEVRTMTTTSEMTYKESRNYQRRWWALVVVILAVIAIGLDQTVLNVAIPTLQRELGATASELIWMVDAYIVVFAATLLVCGALGDRYGRAKAFYLGLIIFGLSLQTHYSYYGSVYHIINHALFKSALFLTAGIIIDHYGTRDIDDIKGVFRTMPFVGTVMCIAILGITGAPLFNGSISKYLIQEGTSNSDLLEYGLVLINIGTIAYFLRLGKILLGPSKSKTRIPVPQKAVVGILGLLCFVGGIFGHYLVGVFFELHIKWEVKDYLVKLLIYLGSIAIGLLFYHFIYKKVKLFHTLREIELTFNELTMSIVTFFAGLLGYMIMTV